MNELVSIQAPRTVSSAPHELDRAGGDRRRRRARRAPLPRILRRHDPQPEHAHGLLPGCGRSSPGATCTARRTRRHRAAACRGLYRGAAARIAKPTVKQHLAAVRMLFDWLVVGQVLAVNPAHAVRGPKHVVKRGKTPVLIADEARAPDRKHPGRQEDHPTRWYEREAPWLVGLRDRALIGRDDLLPLPASAPSSPCGSRTITRRASAGGCASTRKAASATKCRRTTSSKSSSTNISGRPDIRDDGKGPLFRSAVGRTGVLTATPMNRVDAYRMVRRRTAEAGFKSRLGCHASARPASQPTLSAAARSKTRRPWPRTKARARPSSTTAPAMRSRSMRLRRYRFETRIPPAG